MTMETNKARQLQKKIDYLLEPMGLTTRIAIAMSRTDNSLMPSGPIKLIDMQNHEVYYDNGLFQDKQLFGSINRVFEKLGKIRYFIVKVSLFVYKTVNNVYYGCNSLEEMMIKRELVF